MLDKPLLSEKEQDNILLVLQSLSALQYPEVNDVLSKLSSLFKKSNVNWIEVDFSNWGSDKKQKEAFSVLKSAILEKRVIIFSYFNANGETSDRHVEPVKLLLKDKAWYLQGYCLERMSCRTFKITRITNIHITEESSIRLNPQDIMPMSVAGEAGEQIILNLKISSEGAYRVYDDFAEKDITKNFEAASSLFFYKF